MHFLRGEGQYLWDSEGKQYLDFFAGLMTVSSGHCVPEITDAICLQAQRLQQTSTLYLIEPMVELAELLVELAPGPLSRVFFVNSGSEAVDGALMLACAVKRSNEVIALRHAYHGRSFAATAVTGLEAWKPVPYTPFEVKFALSPYCYRCPLGLSYPSCDILCARDVERILETEVSGAPAAFIAEPIQGLGGYIVPPPGYFRRVKEILDRHGILFVVDEVQTGIGRTGRMFCIEHYEVEPDILAVGKGLGNGVPCAAYLCREEIGAAFTKKHISTWGGNPLSTAGAQANLRYLIDHDLTANARERGEELLEALRELMPAYRVMGDLRGKGLMIGIELVKEGKRPAAEEAAKVMSLAKEEGLLLGLGGLYGNVIRIVPPLCISREDVETAVSVFERILGRVASDEQ